MAAKKPQRFDVAELESELIAVEAEIRIVLEAIEADEKTAHDEFLARVYTVLDRIADRLTVAIQGGANGAAPKAG